MNQEEFQQYFSQDGTSFFVEEDKANVEYQAAAEQDGSCVRVFATAVRLTSNLEGKLSASQEGDDCIFTLDGIGKAFSLRVKPRPDGTFYAVMTSHTYAQNL